MVRWFLLFCCFGCFIPCVVFAAWGEAGQRGFLPGLLPSSWLEKEIRDNPVAFIGLDSSVYREVSLNYTGFGGHSLYSVFDGSGGNRVTLAARGYKVVSGKGIYSGAASWEQGKNRDVRWTNVRDVRWLYPYLVADSLGGDYHYERYRLEGSWGVYAGRGVYGLRGKYRGEVAYRLRDPRPRNTVSELVLNPGMRWWGENWYAGIWGKYNFYRQHVTTKIVEPYRKDLFYILTGLGLYDYYFSSVGNSFSRYYRSHMYEGGVQAGQQGVAVFLTYSYRRMEVEESDHRKPFLLQEEGIKAGFRWKRRKGAWRIEGGVEGGMRGRTGFERTFEQVKTDTSTGMTVWRRLTEAKKYRWKYYYGEMDVMFTYCGGRNEWWGSMSSRWEQEQEKYALPFYNQRFSDINGKIRLGFRRRMNRKELEMVGEGGYKKCLSSTLNAPGAQQVVNGMLLPEYGYRRQSYYSGRLGIEFRFPVYTGIRLALYSDISGAYVSRTAYRWQTEAGMKVLF